MNHQQISSTNAVTMATLTQRVEAASNPTGLSSLEQRVTSIEQEQVKQIQALEAFAGWCTYELRQRPRFCNQGNGKWNSNQNYNGKSGFGGFGNNNNNFGPNGDGFGMGNGGRNGSKN